MRTVLLYGELGKLFGRRHSFDVRSPAEAIKALCANFPKFRNFMNNAHHKGFGFRVVVGRDPLDSAKDVHVPIGKKVLKIVPMLFGSGGIPGGAAFRIILGVALVAAALFIPGAQFLGGVGVAFILGGVSSLLTKAPPSADEVKRKTSYYFDGPVNTTVQGIALPIIFGRVKTGSSVISVGVESVEVIE